MQDMDKKILYKFFEGDATQQEKETVKQWLEASEEHHAELFKEREFFDAMILSGNKANKQIYSPTKKKYPLRKIYVEFGKIAAVIAVMVTIGFYFYNGKMKEIGLATHRIVVPAGQRANLQLPDGTNVWLNARSEISYPAYFTGAAREIQLEGEAYLEVHPNKKQPFIVKTKKYDIEVLGTTFNVESYSDSDDFSTALMEGSIKISRQNKPQENILLSAGQKVVDQNGVLTADQIDDYDIYRWREGLICFKETNFAELMQRFEKCFGIQIVIDNLTISKKVFSGKFRISDGIDKALRVLQKDGNYTFERNKDDTIIYIK